ncbi:MAG: hypothetical protein JWO51_2338 [Rhodospirillales bacterium]|nr:hypothetical protein [Rhodospirillales bacterium]
MTYTEQLERETEQTRHQLAETVDELRSRISPGQIVDQLVDYAQGTGGGEFFRNLRRQAVQNPLPITLMGAGLTWLMLSNRRGSSSGLAARPGPAGELGAGAGSSLQDGKAVSSAAQSIGGVVSDASSRVGEAARATTSAARGLASAAASVDLAGSTRTIGRSALDRGRTVTAFVRDQPLLLAGVGIAFGAAIGAVLPGTQAEDRFMGEASEDAKDRLQEAAATGVEKAQQVAEHAVQAVKAGAGEPRVAVPLPSQATGAELPKAPAAARHPDSADDRSAQENADSVE